MRIPAPSLLQRILPSGRHLRFAVLAGGIAMISVAAVACGGDDDDSSATQTTGGVATATATTAATSPATTSTVAAAGTLIPFDTPTPSPTTSASTGATQDVVEMVNMAPCGDKTYFQEQVLPNDVHAITYKDVPEGTPILFPFKEGDLRTADARAGAILMVFDVPDVGVFTIQSAGSESLDRTVRHVTQGEVIGKFGGTFGKEDTSVFEGYQLFAFATREELLRIDDELPTDVGLDPEVTGCLMLP